LKQKGRQGRRGPKSGLEGKKKKKKGCPLEGRFHPMPSTAWKGEEHQHKRRICIAQADIGEVRSHLERASPSVK